MLHQFCFDVKTNVLAGVVDGYGATDTKNDGCPVWPATTQLSVFEKAEPVQGPQAAPKSRFHARRAAWDKIFWPEGNMERKPLAFGEWAASSLAGVERPPLTWEEERERRQQAKKAKEKEAVQK